MVKGDLVVVSMPMNPLAAIAMLARAPLGVVYSVAFGGLASKELAIRIDDAKPTVVTFPDGTVMDAARGSRP